MADTAAHLADHVLPKSRYRQWTLSFPRDIRFALVRHPPLISKALKIALGSIFSFQRSQARRKGVAIPHCGAITMVQRFGSSVNLNLHFHSLLPGGVFVETEEGLQFHRLPIPSEEEMFKICCRIVRRTFAMLEREAPDDMPNESALADLQAESMQTNFNGFPSFEPKDNNKPKKKGRGQSAMVDGFSLHVGGAIHENNRISLEHVLRYGSRPSISGERLSYDGKTVRYRLRKPNLKGETVLSFEPVQFLRRMASLIPPPRQNLTRYHGVFAPRSKLRKATRPKSEGKEANPSCGAGTSPPSYRLAWADLLKRVFEFDVTTCRVCSGKTKVISVIKDPVVIVRILEHLKCPSRPPARAPPLRSDFDFDSYSDDHDFEPA